MSRTTRRNKYNYRGNVPCAGCGEGLTLLDVSAAPLYSASQKASSDVLKLDICEKCSEMLGDKNLYELKLVNHNIRAKGRKVVRVNRLDNPRPRETCITDTLLKGVLLVVSGTSSVHDVDYIIGEDTRNLSDMLMFSHVGIPYVKPKGVIVTNDEELSYQDSHIFHDLRTVMEYVNLTTMMNRVGHHGDLNFSMISSIVKDIIDAEIGDHITKVCRQEHIISGDFLFWAIEYAILDKRPEWDYKEVNLYVKSEEEGIEEVSSHDISNGITFHKYQSWIGSILFHQSMPHNRIYYINGKIMGVSNLYKGNILNSILTRSIYCIRDFPIDMDRVALFRSRGYRVNTGVDHLDSMTPSVERVCALLFLDPDYRCIVMVSILAELLEEIRKIPVGDKNTYTEWI